MTMATEQKIAHMIESIGGDFRRNILIETDDTRAFYTPNGYLVDSNIYALDFQNKKE